MCSSGWSRAGPRPTSSSGCCPGPGRPSGSRLPPMPERRDGQTTLAVERSLEATDLTRLPCSAPVVELGVAAADVVAALALAVVPVPPAAHGDRERAVAAPGAPGEADGPPAAVLRQVPAPPLGPVGPPLAVLVV